MRLANKVAFITGGGQGIGQASAHRFARDGATVAVADINLANAECVAREITAAGGNAFAVELDVRDGQSVEAAVASAVARAGGIDVLLNNAGITKDARLQKMTEEQFDSVVDVNLKGVWLCTKAVAPLMIERQGGSIINVSSVVAASGNFGQTNYAATKAGVIAMTKTWARELGPHGIRVNAVAPGFVATEMVRSVPAKVVEMLEEKTPLRRLGQPDEIANIYAFLASDEASFITGSVIAVDGGLTL
jgi:3-oxoacyl-[acyl-carrier protein] reductase